MPYDLNQAGKHAETLEEMAARYGRELMHMRARQAPSKAAASPVPPAREAAAPAPEEASETAPVLAPEPEAQQAAPVLAPEPEAQQAVPVLVPEPQAGQAASAPAEAVLASAQPEALAASAEPPQQEEAVPVMERVASPAAEPVQPAQVQGAGFLTVMATTANGTQPIMDAHVTISRALPDGNTELMALGETGEDGKSPEFELPAPSVALSEQPGNTQPFSEYTVQVAYPGYYTMIFERVPVFDQIHSTQPASLRPLLIGEDPQEILMTVEREPNL